MANAQQQNIFGFGDMNVPNQWKHIQSFAPESSSSLRTLVNASQMTDLVDAYARRSVAGLSAVDLVAAAGYASFSKQLFYIPMQTPELRWVYLNGAENPTIFSLRSSVLSQLNFNKPEEQITRMTIGKDGRGYALTNDAMHLIEFTTNEQPIVRDLGQLVDDASNALHSVHSPCASFGGDMVAGDDGNIYLITMRNQVYSFEPQKRIAKYIGSVQGLPQPFTSNGAAVSANGALILTCSNGNQNCYQVDPKTWEARPLFDKQPNGFNMSDLASGNLLARRSGIRENESAANQALGENVIHLYPNPLRGGSRLQISMTQAISGNHQMQLMDLSGKIINQQLVNFNAGKQNVQLDLPAEIAKGTYFVKMIDPAANTIQTSKLIIQ
jgi:hypothetical protein